MNNNQTNPNLDNDPRLSHVDPIKLNIIKEIAKGSQSQSVEQMLPKIMKINQELQARGISFTKEETAILMDVIEESLPPKDKMKFNMLKGFMK